MLEDLRGKVGYILRKCDYEPAPLVLAYVLGPMLEQAMRQSLLISNGSFMVSLIRPISGSCLAVAVFLLLLSGVRYARGRRPQGKEE